MTVTPPPAPATTPLWEDFLDIFTSPSAVFERRKDDPAFFVPWIVFVVAIAVLVLGGWSLLEDVYRADQMRGVEKYIASHPDLPANVVEQMRSGGPGAGFVKYIIPVAAGFIVLLVGLVTWVSGKIVGAKTQMGQAFMIAAYAFFPKILGAVASIVLVLVLPETMLTTASHLTLGPAIALDPATTSPALLAFATRLDVFTIWTTVLIALGLKVTGGIDTQKAIIAGVVIWLIGALMPVGMALMAGG